MPSKLSIVYLIYLILLGTTLCHASPASDPQNCERDALGGCNPPPTKIHPCPVARRCPANGDDNPCCGSQQTCTPTGCVGPPDCNGPVCGNECCPTNPLPCPKSCGTACCTNDPTQVRLYWCPPQATNICCPIYESAVLDRTGQNPICCSSPVNEMLSNCDGRCCGGGCATFPLPTGGGTWQACATDAARCGNYIPCRDDWQCTNSGTCGSNGCCTVPILVT